MADSVCVFSNCILDLRLTRFLSFFKIWDVTQAPCWAAQIYAFYCQSKHVLVTCKAQLLSDGHMAAGWKETGRKGRKQWEYFPSSKQRSTVWWEGKKRNTWVVRGFFHDNLLLCMYISVTVFMQENAACFSIVPWFCGLKELLSRVSALLFVKIHLLNRQKLQLETEKAAE